MKEYATQLPFDAILGCARAMPTTPALHEITSRGADPNIVEAHGSPPTGEIEPSSASRVV